MTAILFSACSSESSQGLTLDSTGDADFQEEVWGDISVDALRADAQDSADARDCIEEIEPLDETWSLSAPGVSLVITGNPYSISVLNHQGEAVLNSFMAGEGDGYGPIAESVGAVGWSNLVSDGYYRLSTDFEAWHESWAVTEAVESETGVSLVLVSLESEEPCNRRSISVEHTVEPSLVRVEASILNGDVPRVWSAAFDSGDEEAFLGFGERFNRTDQRGVDVYSWAEEGGIGTGEGDLISDSNPTPNGEAMTYYPVPFFISTGGYGFWLDSTWYNMFNLVTDYDDAWRVWHLGPSLAFEIYTPFPDDERQWPYHLIDQFTERTGRPMVPPAWTFGPRRRINENDEQDGVSEIQAMRDLDLAITALDDSLHFLPAGSHVGKEEQKAEWVDSAEALGYRVNCYYNSLMDSDTTGNLGDWVNQGLESSYFLQDEDGDPYTVILISGSMTTAYQIDFTSPEATSWYQEMFQWALDIGYSGWMYDFGEYVQPETVAGNGMTGEELHNAYPVLYQQAAFEALEASDRAGDWLTFARSGYTGASAYTPMVWGGDPAASFEDSDGLPSMVRAGVNIGISGVPHWGGDIGGFHCVADGYDAADGELLARWIQQGSMGSNMQDQDACSFGTGSGEKASIFNDEDAQQAWAKYARLHTRLFPYLFTLAQTAHLSGAPVMRHLFLEHPDELALASIDDTYYLGSGLLVAPVVVRGARTRDVQLPDADYLFLDEERVVQGPGLVTVDAPLERLPLFLRAGELVPLLDASIDTLAEEDNESVVGPGDVSDVYDIWGFLTSSEMEASISLWDGDIFSAQWGGELPVHPSLAQAENWQDLVSCSECWKLEVLPDGTIKIGVTSQLSEVILGDLVLRQESPRRIRWEIYLYTET